MLLRTIIAAACTYFDVYPLLLDCVRFHARLEDIQRVQLIQ